MALLELGVKDQHTTKALLVALRAGDPFQRARAAEVLGGFRLETETVVAALTEARSDDDNTVRAAAGRALAELSSRAKLTVPAPRRPPELRENPAYRALADLLEDLQPSLQERIKVVEAEEERDRYSRPLSVE